MIITLSRQMGAGGSEVARNVALALEWRLVDNELIDQVAVRSGLSPERVAEREEQAPGFVERLIRTLTRAAPEILSGPDGPDPELEEARLVKITESLVAEVAREGRVVLVGRAAPAVLKDDQNALNVKVVAPKDFRVAVVAARETVSEDEARYRVEQSDTNRALYHRQYYGRDWNDASLYHLVLNTAALGVESVVDTIVGRAKRLWPQETKERRTPSR